MLRKMLIVNTILFAHKMKFKNAENITKNIEDYILTMISWQVTLKNITLTKNKAINITQMME